MKVAEGTVVSMHYSLSDDMGSAIFSTYDHHPFSYLHGHGNIIEGLEAALDGAEAGFQSDVTVPPDRGYGDRNEEAVFEVPRNQFPPSDEITVGMQVRGEGPKGVVAFTVVDLTDDGVMLDGNHPLAGKTLTFGVRVLEVREATEQELAHGHLHSESDGADH